MSDKEIWKDIEGYNGLYQVSSFGRVKSMNRIVEKKDGNVLTIKERILRNNTSSGYCIVGLSKNGKVKFHHIHLLVAISFLNHTKCGFKKVVDHIDNNPLNNKLSNLQIVTNRENSSKDRKGGTSKYIGVSYHKLKNKWAANIYINNPILLGFFDKEEDAAKAYQDKLKELTHLKQRKG